MEIEDAFWNVATYRLVEIYRRFIGVCCIHRYRRGDGVSKHLRNVGVLLPDYMAQQPRRPLP
jgi:hypothetical protein